MKKTFVALIVFILVIALSGIATAAVTLVKVDLSCPGNTATKKGGDWKDFEVSGGCDGDRHDPRAWIDPDTSIRFDCGQPGGHGNVFARGGDPICNTAYQMWINEEAPMMLRISGAGHTAGEYTIEVLHAWNGGSISGLSVSGATSHTILQSGSIVNTESDADLLSAAGSHTLVDYTIASDGQSVTLEWSGITKINGWILHSAVAPPYATDPIPQEGTPDVSPDVTLSWTPGAGATSHDVYLGNDASVVENATTDSAEYQGNELDSSFDPGLLDFGQPYYWRIDELSDTTTTKGNLWSFRVADGKASSPSPGNGSGNNALDSSLSWTAGAMATSHDVYFGEDFDAVNDATTLSGEYMGNQLGTSFDPGPLVKATKYYWRIDELSHTIVKGEVWSFTTVGILHLRVDLAHPLTGARPKKGGGHLWRRAGSICTCTTRCGNEAKAPRAVSHRIPTESLVLVCMLAWISAMETVVFITMICADAT